MSFCFISFSFQHVDVAFALHYSIVSEVERPNNGLRHINFNNAANHFVRGAYQSPKRQCLLL